MTRETGAFEVRQEVDAIPGGRLAKIAALAIVIGVIDVFFSALVLETNTGGIRSHQALAAPPPGADGAIAHIEQAPILGAAEGLDLRRQQREQLSRYRWVDRDAGLVAIPIERAMDLVERGSR